MGKGHTDCLGAPQANGAGRWLLISMVWVDHVTSLVSNISVLFAPSSVIIWVRVDYRWRLIDDVLLRALFSVMMPIMRMLPFVLRFARNVLPNDDVNIQWTYAN